MNHDELNLGLALAYALLSLAASAHILFHKRQPGSALLWLIFVWAAPFAGFVAYWNFGYNRVLESARRSRIMGGHGPGRGPLDRLGDTLTGVPERPHCRVELLEDGARAYPVMLASIAGAKKSVELLSYIFDLDSVGGQFVEALGAAAGRGVYVRVLVDGIGAWFPTSRLRRALRERGVEFQSFWRNDSLFHQPLVNLRNHRKLMVVDGKAVFTGGMNISERHHKGPLSLHRLRALAGSKGVVRDLHFKIQGPVVPDFAAAFEHDWQAAGGRPQALPPRPGRAGSDRVRVLRSGPDRSFERIYELLLGALRLAHHSVDICTPYFIPDAPLLFTLRSIALSGVKVRLFLPKNSDFAFMTWASNAYFKELLEVGVEIRQISGSFVHSKACVIDKDWCMIGSCNLDPRSFRLNFELNAEVGSARLARELSAVMGRYGRHAVEISPETLKGQGYAIGLRNNLAKLLSPFL